MTPIASPTRTTTVDRFLAAIAAGAGGSVSDLYAEDALLDATVPNWRFSRRGSVAIADQYAGWFNHPARFEELERHATADGEVVRYLLSWQEAGVPHAAHHAHVLSVDPASGRITADHVFCGGRWDAALLADMAEADHAG